MEQNDNITCKVVLVGDTGVGKTCIIQRYVNNQYTENNESTVASTYTYKVLDYPEFNKSISFDIWDTAGQELYRALAKNFYLNASIGILVYDIKRKASFESIKNYWYEQLKESGEENMIIGIAGNKCDAFQEEEVSEEEGKSIDELFKECGKKYLEINNLIKNDNKAKNDRVKLQNDTNDNKGNNNNGTKTKKKCC